MCDCKANVEMIARGMWADQTEEAACGEGGKVKEGSSCEGCCCRADQQLCLSHAVLFFFIGEKILEFKQKA